MPATNYMYTDKVFTALDHAPAAFDLRGRILGPNGNNLDYIKSETGAVVFLKGGTTSSDPLHVVLQHSRTDGVSSARSLTLNLIETVKNELQQWSSQTGQGVSTALPGTPEAPSVSTHNTPEPLPQPVNIAPAVTAAPTNSSVVTVRQPTVLQLMPQQQYILNQDGSQLIPLIQSGQIPGQTNFTQLISSFPQNSNATQFVDANMQPVSLAQFRLSGVPNSMPTIIQSGLPLSQVSLSNQDSTTVSYTSLLPVSSTVSSPSVGAGPVVHAMQTGGQKVQWSSEKMEKGAEVKYQYQVAGAEPVQLSMPATGQTMYIPYQQLQELTGQSTATLQPQFVSISASGGMGGWPASASLPLQQISQLPPGAALNPNVLQLNQKAAPGNTSVINLWSSQPGAASVPAQIAPAQQIIAPQPAQIWSNQQMQIAASQGTTLTPIPPNTQWVRAPAVASAAELIPLNNPNKAPGGQEPRAQKRMSDGTPSQLQLRPIAPAGSHISQQDKSNGARDSRPVLWTANTGREISGNSGNQMTQKSSNTRGPLPVSSSHQISTGSITITARDSTSSPARHLDKNAIPTSQEITSKSTEATNKVSTLPQNIQMYAVSSNGTPIQNITQLPTSMAQPNTHMNHMYIVSSSQGTGLQSVALPQNTMMGQTLQVGQGNVPMMQPNQLALPQGVQYNFLPQQMQYITSGLNLNNPATAQQLGLTMAGQQVLSPAMLANLQSGNPNQMAQLNQPIQGLHNQVAQSSQTAGSIQYNTTQMQGVSQPAAQFITPNSQQQVVSNAYISPASQFAGQPAQFTTHQGNFIMPAQGNAQLQYNLVNQQISTATQINSSVQPGEQRATVGNTSQPSIYAANTPNSNQQTTFGPGSTQQTFPPGAQISQTANQQTFPPGVQISQTPNQQAFPAVGSPGTNQQPPLSAESATNAQVGNYASGVAPNQAGNYQQTNTPAFTSGNAGPTGQPATFNGGQYGAGNNSKAWPGPRFSGAPSNRPQFTVQARPDQPPPAPTPGAPSPTNPNYWQFS